MLFYCHDFYYLCLGLYIYSQNRFQYVILNNYASLEDSWPLWVEAPMHCIILNNYASLEDSWPLWVGDPAH